jgi:hypothetical protein
MVDAGWLVFCALPLIAGAMWLHLWRISDERIKRKFGGALVLVTGGGSGLGR